MYGTILLLHYQFYWLWVCLMDGAVEVVLMYTVLLYKTSRMNSGWVWSVLAAQYLHHILFLRSHSLSFSFFFSFLQQSAVAKQSAQCNKEQLEHKHAGRQHSLSTQPTSAQRKLTLFWYSLSLQYKLSLSLSLSIYPLHNTSNCKDRKETLTLRWKNAAP